MFLRLTQPLNAILGRRGTIVLTCLFSIVSCLLQAFSQNWRMMVGFRILLGVGFGLKSATIPIYTSECAPAKFRGALVMFWQFFTALGIMFGYICAAIFRGVLDGTNNAVCSQPTIPPPTVPTPKAPEVQRTLLSIRCVSNHASTACCVSVATASDGNLQADPWTHFRASIGESWSQRR